MDYREWQLKRRDLQAREIAERSGNLESARAPLQVAITEQAIRELYDKIEGERKFAVSLEERLNIMENASREIGQYKRGLGRPPKSEGE